jgi:hypothetical protein
MGNNSKAYRILVGKPEGKKPVGRPRHRWEDNTRWICERSDWIDLDQDRDWWRALVNTVIKFQVP